MLKSRRIRLVVRMTFLSPGIVGLIACAIGYFLAAGCRGPAGPDGKDSKLADPLPPQIEWISPAPGVEVDTSLLLQVHAADNVGVYRVSFYIAGFEFAAILSDSAAGRYDFLWDAQGYPEGPYPLMARVWDESRQTGTTPVRVIEVKH